jgi:hypothetical protein
VADPSDGNLSSRERRVIFRAVVEAQDKGSGVAESRELVARRFGVSVATVKSIETEGLIEEWLDLC